MQFVERVAALAKENGITEKQVLLDCKLNKNLFGLWRQGRTPSTATKRVLADYFGVSVEYLMGDSDDRGIKKAPTPGTSVEAMYIAELANSLPDQQRKEAVAYLLALRKEADSEK
jgi:transcriptional regulator with XRE-family HTH domain